MGYGVRKKVDPAQKQQERYYAMLEVMLKQPGNDVCADCPTKGPRWASVNLGIFVCIRCSGIHRHMGTHISKVRSVSLDKWLPEHIETMQKMGNAKARRIYEGRLPPNYRRPREHDAHGIEQWIRDKYDRKVFYDAAAAAEIAAENSNGGAGGAPAGEAAPRQSSGRQERPRRKLSGHNLSQESTRPAQQQAANTASLIDAPLPSQQTSPAPAAATGGPPAGWSTPGTVQVPTGQEDFFSDFVSAPVASSAAGQQTGSFFDSQPQAAAPPQQQKASKNDILSLFKQQAPPQQQMGMGMNQMGMGMNQMGMNQMAMNQMGMNQMAMNQMAMNQQQMAMNQQRMAMNQFGMGGMGMQQQQQPQQNQNAFGFQAYNNQQQQQPQQNPNPFGF